MISFLSKAGKLKHPIWLLLLQNMFVILSIVNLTIKLFATSLHIMFRNYISLIIYALKGNNIIFVLSLCLDECELAELLLSKGAYVDPVWE